MKLKTIYICICLLLYNTSFSDNINFPRRVNSKNLDKTNSTELLLINAIKSTTIDSGIFYFDAFIKTQKDTSKFILYALLHSANKSIHMQQFEIAKTKISRCLKIALKNNSEYYIYQSYLLYAQIEHLNKNIDASIDWHDKAIKSTNDEYLINFAKLSLANLYYSKKEEKSTKIGNELNEDIYKYYLDNNKIIQPNLACQMLINKSLNDTLGQSLEYIKEANRLVEDHPFSSLKIKVSKEYARVLLINKKEKEALIIFNKLIDICNKKNDFQEVQLLNISLAKYYNSNKQYKKSQSILNRILASKHQQNYKPSILKWSINNYAGLNDFEQAYKYNQQLTALNDSIQKSKENLKYTEWAIRYKTEKKEHENELLKKENTIKKIELEQNKFYFVILLISIIVTLIFVLIFYNLFNKKKRSEKQLAISNKTILEQNNKLQIANKTKSTFFTLIAHDLINPYNVIMGYSDLLNNNYHHFSEEKVQEFIAKINTSVHNNYGFVKNLLYWAKANQSQISTELKPIFFSDLISETILPLTLLLEKKSINLENKITYSSPITTDKQILKTVLFNIITNAIKFTPKEGRITITDLYQNGYYYIMVKDNGVGISEKSIKELFLLSKMHSTKGTDNETGGGLGLLLCIELIRLIKGELIITSEKGTEVKIKIKNEHRENNRMHN